LADLEADPDAPALVLVTHHVRRVRPVFSHCMLCPGDGTSRQFAVRVLTGDNRSAAFGSSRLQST